MVSTTSPASWAAQVSISSSARVCRAVTAWKARHCKCIDSGRGCKDRTRAMRSNKLCKDALENEGRDRFPAISAALQAKVKLASGFAKLTLSILALSFLCNLQRSRSRSCFYFVTLVRSSLWLSDRIGVNCQSSPHVSVRIGGVAIVDLNSNFDMLGKAIEPIGISIDD